MVHCRRGQRTFAEVRALLLPCETRDQAQVASLSGRQLDQVSYLAGHLGIFYILHTDSLSTVYRLSVAFWKGNTSSER